MSDTTENPLDNFSGCHEGIINNFSQLADLPAAFLEAGKAAYIQQNAKRFLAFFESIVLKHHAEEEQELFSAVRHARGAGAAELALAIQHIDRLTREHRELEQGWKVLAADLKLLAKGKLATLDAGAIRDFSARYLAHAEFEEQVFLPMAQALLDSNGMSALGMSLHIRHMGHQYIPSYI